MCVWDGGMEGRKGERRKTNRRQDLVQCLLIDPTNDKKQIWPLRFLISDCRVLSPNYKILIGEPRFFNKVCVGWWWWWGEERRKEVFLNVWQTFSIIDRGPTLPGVEHRTERRLKHILKNHYFSHFLLFATPPPSSLPPPPLPFILLSPPLSYPPPPTG